MKGKKIKSILLIAIFILSTITLTIPLASAPVPGPVGSSRWKTFTPVIDGDIEDAWLDVASSFGLIDDFDSQPTGDLVYVMNDEEYLYVAFDINYPTIDIENWAWAGILVYLPGESEMNTVGFGASGVESTGEWIIEPVDTLGIRGSPAVFITGATAITAAGLSYNLAVTHSSTQCWSPAEAEMKVLLSDLGISPGDTVKLLFTLLDRTTGDYYRYPELTSNDASSNTNEYMSFTLATTEYIDVEYEVQDNVGDGGEVAEWALDPLPTGIYGDHGHVAKLSRDTAADWDAAFVRIYNDDSAVTLENFLTNVKFDYYLPAEYTPNPLMLEFDFYTADGDWMLITLDPTHPLYLRR